MGTIIKYTLSHLYIPCHGSAWVLLQKVLALLLDLVRRDSTRVTDLIHDIVCDNDFSFLVSHSATNHSHGNSGLQTELRVSFI